jgi:hypothetical protein
VGDWRLKEREREASKSQVCSFALRAQKYFQKMNDSVRSGRRRGRERVEVADAGRRERASALEGNIYSRGKGDKRYALLRLLVWFVSFC